MRHLILLGAIAASCCASLAYGQALPAAISGPSFEASAIAGPPALFSQFGREQDRDTIAPESVILPVQWLEPLGPSEPASGSAAAGSNNGRLMSLFSGRAGPTNWRADCDDCPTHGISVLVGYDAWRGISNGDWGTNGIHTGLNYGTRLGQFSELTGIGFQIGGSIGVYDWSGTDYRPLNNTAETQGFLTYGFFRKQNAQSNWSAALVQDWMFNNNFGEYSQNPTMSQVRGQVGYATNAWNEIGLWGTASCTTATANISGVGPTTWRALNQLDAFWHHKWQQGGADTWLYAGAPLGSSLSSGSTLGSFVVSAAANVPLSNRVALYTLVTYLRPSAQAGPAGSEEDAWNFTIGLSYYPRRNARSNTVAGQCWMPQLPVANNGFFLVDTNRH